MLAVKTLERPNLTTFLYKHRIHLLFILLNFEYITVYYDPKGN